MCYVYILTFLPDQFFYVGSTQDLDIRIKTHVENLKRNSHPNTNMQKYWNDHNGNINFNVSSFTVNSREDAYSLEQKYLDYFFNSNLSHKLLNIGRGAFGGDNLSSNPNRESIINNITSTLLKNSSLLTKEEKVLKYGQKGPKNGMYGKTHTEEVRKRLSINSIGHSWNKGIKLSKEHVEKIRQRAKLSIGVKNPFYGKHHSEETKRILSLKHMGQPCPTKKKISVNGIIFNSMDEASKFFNVSSSLVSHRVRSKLYPEWIYI